MCAPSSPCLGWELWVLLLVISFHVGILHLTSVIPNWLFSVPLYRTTANCYFESSNVDLFDLNVFTERVNFNIFKILQEMAKSVHNAMLKLAYKNFQTSGRSGWIRSIVKWFCFIYGIFSRIIELSQQRLRLKSKSKEKFRFFLKAEFIYR